jgi:N utilization substance protein B
MASEPFDAEFGSDDPQIPDNRRGARQVALQALYWDAVSPGDAQRAVGELTSRWALSAEVGQFAGQLVAAVVAHRPELEEMISITATRWPQERMARVDRLILLLGLAEIFHCEGIPTRVSIDEAVELAKLYGGGPSYAFVNGVLDAVVRRHGMAL